MASANRRASNAQRKSSTAKRSGASKQDAIALLKADHREVEGWFSQFEKARSEDKKSDLAQKICKALKTHTRIEEEIFYPAFLESVGDKDLHHEAEIEHDAAKKLIAEIDASGPDDEYYDSKVKVLSEMIKHHVKEEEQPGGMFAEARKSDMDLQALGEQMKSRKNELMNGTSAARPNRNSNSRMGDHVDRL